ncbi:hypothetical protein GCL60_07905 [Silvanigrella paludirubra]|uniref:Uncharacterized protein n=1 Tax=Silvanigrella paludirubra TaxID=2499159 RepID=A0A6N6VS52_9BACT|nr:hypothetical protein [Silvanigrella paludirubra]KAB8038778.1 hypothetical protein GCL60_07905 [Silvanigrella paludirubra]
MDLILKREIELENEFIFNEFFKNGILEKYLIERVDVKEYWEIYYSDFFDHYPDELFFIREDLLNEEQKRSDLN